MSDVVVSVTMLRPEEKLLLTALRSQGLEATAALRDDLAGLVDGPDTPAVALIRNLSHAEAHSVARRLELAGVHVLNSAAAIEVCNDKGLQAIAFARESVPHPESRHAWSVDQVREAVRAVGWPAVIKPVSGAWGRGVTRVLDEPCLEAWIGGRESADGSGKLFPVLVQRHVDKPGSDLRVVVVGRTPIAAIRRSSADWRTNTHLGASIEGVPVTRDMAKLCAQVVDVLGDGFYGVDLVEDRLTGELLVLEVNANPDFARSSAVHGVDVAGHLAAYIAERVRVPAAV
ncbi:ATP-dependent carboxylate-amine/thiol ligase [Actinorhabdospora filicis]|uniref:ATP-dependent carboxylate-amine/thiol ligase n=1 Tax=Actinorhabdospora filicis TaxID=1785913 RepID=A0A9W6SMH2_9ACTN|nr:RimK family alpha-L-glutamate ligase [Actinorhabdospora filicis]GLZ79649.1 ATP-dependent carboxylate-amine/thiol ligase [Actinorhabdospora filicis]